MQRSATIVAAILLSACASQTASPPALTTERIAAIVASPDRSAADRTNDIRRKPVEMLTFIGVRPGMIVLDVFAGGGYTSELLARAVAPNGRVYAQSAPPPIPAPSPPRRTSAMAIAERARNPAASNMTAVAAPYSNPIPPELPNRSLDLVTLMFNYHDFGWMGVDRASTNRAIYAALKPGGLYVIADHAGRGGTGISESGTLHRVEEEFVVREVEAAGFRLVERGSFLRNPADPRDREDPDPPMPKDEFVLKFVKPS
jgi:predicted methyltransferase